MNLTKLFIASTACSCVTTAVVQFASRPELNPTRLKEIALISFAFSLPIPQIAGHVVRNTFASRLTFDTYDKTLYAQNKVEGDVYVLTTIAVACFAKKIFNLSKKMSAALWLVSIISYFWARESRTLRRWGF